MVKFVREITTTLGSLFRGMGVTGHYFIRPKERLTEMYPDNKDTLILAERFKGEVVMPHNENNEHRCTGCTACEIACPNGSIKVITVMEVNEAGKKKKRLDVLKYNLGMCTFCSLCIESCPSDAIKMSNNFEHSVYDRAVLLKNLNQSGSVLNKELDK
jgi:NADH-quinone oxidoreductase subunit I